MRIVSAILLRVPLVAIIVGLDGTWRVVGWVSLGLSFALDIGLWLYRRGKPPTPPKPPGVPRDGDSRWWPSKDPADYR